jgi:hypothetical protein
MGRQQAREANMPNMGQNNANANSGNNNAARI